MRYFRNTKKVYRYTSNEEGVFSAGKRLLPSELIKEAAAARKWIPKPDLAKGEYCFYLTKKGKSQYEKTLLKVHKKYLKNIKKETRFLSEIGKVIYQDEWQVVVAV